MTSAGAGPSLGKYLLMSYLPPEYAEVGEELSVLYMGERYPVTVAVAGSMPLFDPDNERVGGRGRGGHVRILVCAKRVPLTGGRMVLTADERALETRHLGFTISPHEECGVEEAVRLVEKHGGEVTATLGPSEAEEQIRETLATGADRGILLAGGGEEWDLQATAAAIVATIREEEAAGGGAFDLIASETSPPTRATSRWGSGWRTRWDGRWPRD